MKKLLTLLSVSLITLISFNAKAQDEGEEKPTAKSNMMFFGGISSALGDFAQSNYYNNSAGFAKRGVTFGLDAAVYIHKNFGIGLTIAYQDQGELSTADVQTLSDGYNQAFDRDQTSVTSVNRYHNITLMAGPQYSFLYKSFTLDLRADAGLIKSTSSPLISTAFDGAYNASLFQLSSKSSALAYGGSVGLRYSLGESWDIGLRGNYIKSDGFKISNTDDITNVGRIVTKQPVTLLQTTLGITLKF